MKDTSRVPSELTPLAPHQRKWGFCAGALVAMKIERANMVRMRMLNFFIGYL